MRQRRFVTHRFFVSCPSTIGNATKHRSDDAHEGADSHDYSVWLKLRRELVKENTSSRIASAVRIQARNVRSFAKVNR